VLTGNHCRQVCGNSPLRSALGKRLYYSDCRLPVCPSDRQTQAINLKPDWTLQGSGHFEVQDLVLKISGLGCHTGLLDQFYCIAQECTFNMIIDGDRQ